MTLKHPWTNLILAPLWFLIVIIVFSIFLSGKGISETDIPKKITENIPTIILIIQIFMFLVLYLTSKKDNFNIFKNGWTLADKSQVSVNILYGLFTGIILSLLYFAVLSPLQTYLQRNIGDYVPAGETMTKLGMQTIPFFFANVIFAPFVEESLYRNYVLTKFLEKYTFAKSIILNSIFFGLLHWAGGIWYVFITALFIGMPFAMIAVKKRNIIWVFSAHLTLNLIEFIYITTQT